MRVVWRQRAEQELRRHFIFFGAGIRPSRRAGVREVVITGTPYIAVYRVLDDEVTVLRFFHVRQRR